MPVVNPPGPLLAGETGLDNLQWVYEVREAVRDYVLETIETGVADGVNGQPGPGSIPYRVSRPPVADGTVAVQAGASVPVVRERDKQVAGFLPAAGDVLVDLDVGSLWFGTQPAAGVALTVKYAPVNWRDRTIITALYSALRKMPKHVGRADQDITLQPKLNVWDYRLPSWAADPRALILNLEIRDPDVPTQDFKPVNRYSRLTTSMLRIPASQNYSPAGRFRITYWVPYADLKDMEPALYHLPIIGAAGMLLLKQASLQARKDSLPAVQQAAGGGVSKVAEIRDLGHAYLQEFKEGLAELSRVPGPGRRMRIVTPYDR